MAKKMLFNVNEPEEIRGAIIANGKLFDYDIETRLREKNRNNIYRGFVVKVESSIQAAFVEYGGQRHGFLPFRNIHKDFWSKEPPKDKRRLHIDDVIQKGQAVVVQVEREEIANKGAGLTTYCTIPGRYLVLRPLATGIGVSTKIEDSQERRALRDMVQELKPPEGFGYIIRTAGMGVDQAELERELNYLTRLWKTIQREARRDPRVGMVFQDADLIMRMIRDYYDKDVEEIWVDSPEAFARARSYFSAVISDSSNILKLYEGQRPLFASHGVERQIAQVYERKIPLPSGGSICIDPTEALISIDVNSGKTQSDKGIEDTALKTNMEAADEIARQLRLRDLGGLIVIDFIGMKLARNMRRVERQIRQALKADKARIKVGRFSSLFGLLSLSRQRIRDSKELGHFVDCPSCQGLGKLPNVEASALLVLRHLQDAASRGSYERLEANLPHAVAVYLLNQKRSDIVEMELEFEVEILVRPRSGFRVDMDQDFIFYSAKKDSKRRRHGSRLRSRFIKASAPKPRDDETPNRVDAPENKGQEPTAEVRREPKAQEGRESHKSRSERPSSSRSRPERSDSHGQTQEARPSREAVESPKEARKEASAPQAIQLPDYKSNPVPEGLPWFLRYLRNTGPSRPGASLRKAQTQERPSKGAQPSAPKADSSPEKAQAPQSSRASDLENVASAHVKEAMRRFRTSRNQARSEESKSNGRGVKPEQKGEPEPKSPRPAEGKQSMLGRMQRSAQSNKKIAQGLAQSRRSRELQEQARTAESTNRDASQAATPAPTTSAPATPAPATPAPATPAPATPAPEASPDAQAPSTAVLQTEAAEAPKSGASLWSAEEIERMRAAIHNEERRVTRLKYKPGEEEEVTAQAQDPAEEAPEATEDVSAEAPVEDVTAEASVEEGDTAEISEPDARVEEDDEPEAASEQQEVTAARGHGSSNGDAPRKSKRSPRTKSSNSKRPKRWSDEELSLLRSLQHLSWQDAQKEFESQGFSRSSNAFRNKFYTVAREAKQ